MYKCKYFEIYELVPPELMSLPEDYLWGLFDENLLRVIDNLRKALAKPITINTWKSGGEFSLRGFRPKSTKIGAKNSPHKKGKALDFDVFGMTAQQVRDYIIKNHAKFPEIKRMEKDVTWVHIDTVPNKNDALYLFHP
jgi:hypothetical protein